MGLQFEPPARTICITMSQTEGHSMGTAMPDDATAGETLQQRVLRAARCLVPAVLAGTAIAEVPKGATRSALESPLHAPMNPEQ